MNFQPFSALWWSAGGMIAVGSFGGLHLDDLRHVALPVPAPLSVATRPSFPPSSLPPLAISLHWERQPNALIALHIKDMDIQTLSPTQQTAWLGGLLWWQQLRQAGRYQLFVELTHPYREPVTVYGVMVHQHAVLRLPTTAVFTPGQLAHLGDLEIDEGGHMTLFSPPTL